MLTISKQVNKERVCHYIGYDINYKPPARILSLIDDYVDNIHHLILPAYSYNIRDIERIEGNSGAGIVVTVKDTGPGISDIDLAMRDGYSTSNGLGNGLGGSKRLMDEFSIDSAKDKGTRIRMVKWLR